MSPIINKMSTIIIRVDEHTFDIIKGLAKLDDRTIPKYVARLLKAYADNKGFDNPEETIKFDSRGEPL